MIVGMFPVDSHIAEVLFDTRATHSFITASWVEAHNLPITTMSTPIQINSAGGRIRADSICLNVSVEIRGIAFPACRCFGSDRTPGVAPQGVSRSRTVSTTVAKWFVPIARGTVDKIYRFGPLRDA
jgi:hypothetical protein